MTGKFDNTINKMRLKKLNKTLNSINKMSHVFSEYTDEALKAKTQEFKKRIMAVSYTHLTLPTNREV